MKQYHDLLKAIKTDGTHKPAAREGMPGSTSLFGYQLRHNLSEGFPLLTTKKMYWKGIVVELLWFLRGDTNIKYLLDNGVNIWNEDAYQYYQKQKYIIRYFSFEQFIEYIKKTPYKELGREGNYTLGDCGHQYGKVWRKWEKISHDEMPPSYENNIEYIDQISNLINGLRNTPESRRHIVTSLDPAHDQDLALYWCHCLMQFNCRPLTPEQRIKFAKDNSINIGLDENQNFKWTCLVPKYYLDCQIYQRSADVLLGVPFNIASYALLTHILAKMCSMIPGEFIHTFGDVHIYDNHMEAVNEQLERLCEPLPELKFSPMLLTSGVFELEHIEMWLWDMFKLYNYNHHPKLQSEAKLSTGL